LRAPMLGVGCSVVAISPPYEPATDATAFTMLW
jgi:hypothetical protein